MKRVAFFTMAVAALAFAGCSSDSSSSGGTGGGGGSGGSGPCEHECEVSSQCPGLNEVCLDGCCAPWRGCTTDSCPEGQFCAETGSCTSVADVCENEAQCECHIVGAAGRINVPQNATDLTRIVMTPGTTQEIKVMVAVENGSPLPGATFTLGVENGALFTVTGTSVQASAGAGGTTTLTATVAGLTNAVTCQADVINLGNPPANELRFYLFDDLSGEPIADGPGQDVQILVDAGNEGSIEETITTDANGIAVTTTQPAHPYTVTVFAEGYNYLSLVNINATDVAVPLSNRLDDPVVGGYTGRVSYDPYVERYLDGRPKTISATLASGSIPLQALLNFDLSVFIGELPTGECTGGNDGCYDITFPGFDPIRAPLPGGLAVALSSTPIKEHVDVVGVPGRRFAWSLGGMVDIGDLAGLIGVVLPLVSDCACDASSGTCDFDNAAGEDCSCDSDCGLNLDFGELFNGLLPLLSKFASGVQGNLPLKALPSSQWNDYISDDYATRLDDPDYPKLDTGTSYGKLELREGLSIFSNVAVPELPDDSNGNPMEAIILATGVETVGQGFVPLGIGAGIDCTEGDCLDRSGGAGAGVFDGVVNGAVMCEYDADPLENECPPGVDPETTDGHIGLFHAPAHSGMQDGEWRTVMASLPISALLSSQGTDIQASITGTIGEINAGDTSQLASLSFPAIPNDTALIPASGKGAAAGDRVTSINVAGSSHDLHWFTFATAAPQLGGAPTATTRWNVFVSGTGASFSPPAPAGEDPFLTANDPTGDIPEGRINVTHIGFKFLEDGTTLDSLAANGARSLADLMRVVEGLGIITHDLCGLTDAANCPAPTP